MSRTSKTIRAWGLILVFLAAGLPALAAQNRPAGRAEQAAPPIRENIITLKLLRMTQALGLTQEQTAAIYPVLTRLENEKYGLTRKLSRALRDLREEVGRAQPGETRLRELISTIDRLREEISANDRKMTEFVRSKLTVEQSAKYLLFTVEFYRGLGERLNRARQLRGKNRFTF
jgi:Spy/CpxP family protein refolding chaperone